MIGNCDPRPNLRDPVVSVDRIYRPYDAHESSAIEMLFCPYAIGLQHNLRLVRQVGEAKPVRFTKALLGRYRIGRRPHNRRIGILELGPQAVEIGGFPRAACSPGPRIEIDHQPSAHVILEPQRSTAVPLETEIGRFCTGCEQTRHAPCFRPLCSLDTAAETGVRRTVRRVRFSAGYRRAHLAAWGRGTLRLAHL